MINLVHGLGEPTGSALADHPGVDMVAFTGSTATGRRVMAAAAGTLKRVSLQCSGKAPSLVFADCQLDKALDALSFGAFLYAGQSCTAAARIIVERPLYDEFVPPLAALAEAMPVGDPFEPATLIGPLVSSIWTTDVNRALRVSRRLEAGDVWINTHYLRKPETPFGGWKQSGTGRQLGLAGVREYLACKRIAFDASPDPHLKAGGNGTPARRTPIRVCISRSICYNISVTRYQPALGVDDDARILEPACHRKPVMGDDELSVDAPSAQQHITDHPLLRPGTRRGPRCRRSRHVAFPWDRGGPLPAWGSRRHQIRGRFSAPGAYPLSGRSVMPRPAPFE